MVYTGNCTSIKDTSFTTYGIVGVYLGQMVFSITVPVSSRASTYDAEMYAFAHSLTPIARFIKDKPVISLVNVIVMTFWYVYSDGLNFFFELFKLYSSLGIDHNPHVHYVHMTYVYSPFSLWFIPHTSIRPREVVIVL